MDDKQLDDMLSRLTAPEPQESAKKQALERSLAAFDKKMAQKTQGSAAPGRLTDIINKFNDVRRQIMKKRYVLSGLAGGVALCAMVAVLGAPFYQEQIQRIAGPEDLEFAKDHLRMEGADDVSLSTDVDSAGGAKGRSDKAKQELNEVRAVSDSAVLGRRAEEEPAVVSPEKKLFHAGAESDGRARQLPTAPVPATSSSAMNMIAIAPKQDTIAYQYKETGRDKFEAIEENAIKNVKTEPVSTFSIDVDTASYSFMRRQLNSGVLPQKDAVRIEELINYFDYDYEVPSSKEQPFLPTVAVYDSPWRAGAKLVHVGIKGYEVQEKPKSNLVFLLDTSGSMHSADKLPLLVNSFKLLLDSLSPDDTVGIVVYAGSAGTVLEPTKASDKQKIIAALERLQAGGSTAGGEGLRQAYALAESTFVKGGNNRIILATDGDFNVGISNPDELKGFVERKRDSGIFLSVLGFGQGNYNDALMQELAQNGNGTAAYIDTLSEARKVLVDEVNKTLFTIAKDVKIQVEFNPLTVQEYRLVGYETRALKREDFNNDKVDAGDVGAGASVTAIYEITPVGAAPVVDGLRYGAGKKFVAQTVEEKSVVLNEYAFLKIRYKKPDGDTSILMDRSITQADEKPFASLPDDIRFASAVAGFGQLLKGGKYAGSLTYDHVIETATAARGKDEYGYRSEFINLVRLAKTAAAMTAEQ